MPTTFYPHRARCVAAQHPAPAVFTPAFILWCGAIAVVAAAWAAVF